MQSREDSVIIKTIANFAALLHDGMDEDFDRIGEMEWFPVLKKYLKKIKNQDDM